MHVGALNSNEFLSRMPEGVVLDVRSPGEYRQGHIPGAVSFPLFTDEERAEVGTLYKQQGQQQAIEKGLELVGPKMAAWVKHARELSGGKPLFVHCWRGGMRSSSMAWLLATAGMRVFTLLGGYKAYRHQVLVGVSRPCRLIVLGGETGSGKTEVLHALRQQGEQVIDLEGLANHKGSSFGGIGQEGQPSSEYFTNLLHAELCKLDATRPVWLEDESRMIGKVHVAPDFYEAMCSAPLVVLQVPLGVRVERLVRDYGNTDSNLLREAFERIRKKIGGQHLNDALEALHQNDLMRAATIALRYYDRAYRFGLECKTNAHITTVPVTEPDVQAIAALLIKLKNEHLHEWIQTSA